MNKLLKKTLLSSTSLLLLSSCSSPNFTSSENLINTTQNIVSKSNSDLDSNISITDMNKIITGTREYLNSRQIWKNVNEMPESMQFYFKRINNKYNVSGNIQVKKSGILFKDYTLILEDSNKKERVTLTTKEFILNKNAEKWLATIPQNKVVKVSFTVRKVNWTENDVEPFVLDKIQ